VTISEDCKIVGAVFVVIVIMIMVIKLIILKFDLQHLGLKNGASLK
jgi:hypothetical protein